MKNQFFLTFYGFHPIRWDKVATPKESGGLGFRKLTVMNRAFGTKLAWSVVTGATGLWAEVLGSKYLLRDEHELLNVQPGDSRIWRFICQHRDLVVEGTRWHIRNGQSVNFFFEDKWLFEDRRIKDMCFRSLIVEEMSSVVAQWVTGGAWDFQRLATIVDGEVLQRLRNTIPPLREARYDVMSWKETPNGQFSISSAYKMIARDPISVHKQVYRLIWRWRGAERIRVFLWIAFNNRLPTKMWRSKWEASSALCDYCNQRCEDVIHVLPDCIYARKM